MQTTPRIGMFDSGFGGFSVWKEVAELIPQTSIVYVGDNAQCPYGSKSEAEIICLSSRIVDFLLQKNCSLIVVACNTATAAAIEYLRQHYTVPFVGMEPAVKPAALKTQSGTVGILATEGTFRGKLFHQTKSRYAHEVRVLTQIGHGLVELVENGQFDTPEAEKLLRQYVEPMLAQQADHLVLGCTHYPFLMPALQRIIGENVEIVNPAPAVAQQVKRLWQDLEKIPQDSSPQHEFYTSGNPENMRLFLEHVRVLPHFPAEIGLF